jgi:hypothetical protein
LIACSKSLSVRIDCAYPTHDFAGVAVSTFPSTTIGLAHRASAGPAQVQDGTRQVGHLLGFWQERQQEEVRWRVRVAIGRTAVQRVGKTLLVVALLEAGADGPALHAALAGDVEGMRQHAGLEPNGHDVEAKPFQAAVVDAGLGILHLADVGIAPEDDAAGAVPLDVLTALVVHHVDVVGVDIVFGFLQQLQQCVGAVHAGGKHHECCGIVFLHKATLQNEHRLVLPNGGLPRRKIRGQ